MPLIVRGPAGGGVMDILPFRLILNIAVVTNTIPNTESPFLYQLEEERRCCSF